MNEKGGKGKRTEWKRGKRKNVLLECENQEKIKKEKQL